MRLVARISRVAHGGPRIVPPRVRCAARASLVPKCSEDRLAVQNGPPESTCDNAHRDWPPDAVQRVSWRFQAILVIVGCGGLSRRPWIELPVARRLSRSCDGGPGSAAHLSCSPSIEMSGSPQSHLPVVEPTRSTVKDGPSTWNMWAGIRRTSPFVAASRPSVSVESARGVSTDEILQRPRVGTSGLHSAGRRQTPKRIPLDTCTQR